MEEKLMEMIKDKMKYVKYYYQIKNKEDREDLIQSTFVRLLEKIRLGKISDNIDEIENYVFISCRNNAIRLRKNITSNNHSNIELSEVDLTYTEKDVDSDERLKYVLSLIQLPLDKEIFNLYIEGYNYIEIGEKVNLPNKKVGKIIRTLIRNIRNHINKEPISPRMTKYKVTNLQTGQTNFHSNLRRLEKIYDIPRRRVELALEYGKPYQETYKIERIL